MKLRPYQTGAIEMTYDWFRSHTEGNPCLVLPTGSGKSHIVAAFCKRAIQQYPRTKVLMLTHQKELIEQNAEKMLGHWPGAPFGIYSASVGKRQLGEPITFAGIQSVRNRSQDLGHIDLVIIDECHLVSHKDEGGYRKLLNALRVLNNNIRVIGLTATPYRLGHGLISEGDALFSDLIEPITIEALVTMGHLAILRSKLTQEHLSTKGVHKRGGEFIEAELQKAVNKTDKNAAIVSEVIRLAGERRSWLFFCTGVEHAEAVKDELTRQGIEAASITGKTPKGERHRLLDGFKSGHLQALTNANVLTTGFDHPGVDLIAMMRPTMSPGLYVQMAGRGMRPAPGKDHCLVLDFAGVVDTHGPITSVRPPTKSGPGDGEPPFKVCDQCMEKVALSARVCPDCGLVFPEPEPLEDKLKLRHDDIMGLEAQDMAVTSWKWRQHTSRKCGEDMFAVTYYGKLSDPAVTEYFTVTRDGEGGERARIRLAMVADKAGVLEIFAAKTMEVAAESMTLGKPPATLQYRRDGRFYNVLDRTWI